MRFFLCMLLLGLCLDARAADPRLNWKTLETDHFLIHYDQSERQLANDVAVIAERTHDHLSKVFDWTPAEKTHLVLSDESDTPNGYVVPFPLLRSVLYISPPDEANTLEDFDDWMSLLIEHEYTHVLHLDKAAGVPLGLRKIFGRNFLLLPNSLEPNWITEGIATWMETDTRAGIGRGQSSLYSMMIRAEVMHGLKPVDQVNLPIGTWPMRTSWYLYGVYFFEFLEDVYGKDAAQRWVNGYSRHLVPFMINTNAYSLFGKDLTQLWGEFQIWLKKKYEPQIRQLEKVKQNTGNRLTHSGYFTNQVLASRDGGAWYIAHGAFATPHLSHIDKHGKIQTLMRVNYGARINGNAAGELLLTQLEVCEEYNFYYDLYRVHDGHLQRLSHCGRYRSAAWQNAHAIIAVHRQGNSDQLVVLDRDGKQKRVLWQGDGEIIGPIKINPGTGELVASVFRPGNGWNIEIFDLDKLKWHALTRDPAIDLSPSFDSKGNILFSSDRDGVYNLYRYNPAARQLVQLTHVVSGAFTPSQFGDAMPLYYIGYGANGYDVYRTSSKPATKQIALKKQPMHKSSPGHVRELKPERDYSPWQSLRPRWWMPMVIVDQEQAIYGFETSGNDALGVQNYSLSYGYDTTNQWSIGQLKYNYANHVHLGINRYNSILNDTTGTLALVRKKTDAFGIYSIPITRLYRRQNLLLGLLSSTAKDGRRDVGLLPLGRRRDNLAGAAYIFDNAESSILGISRTNGRNLRFVGESDDVFESDYSGNVYTFNWREYIGLGKQDVLAWHFVQGWGTDKPDPFQLGGESSSLDFFSLLEPSGEPVFGRREYNLRGYQKGLPQLRGRRMQIASLEWRFPLKLVERGLMAPPIGLLQWSGSLFTESGAAWDEGGSPDQYYSSVGMELNNDINIFYGINLRLRLGYAHGLDDKLGEDRFYLSLGSSF